MTDAPASPPAQKPRPLSPHLQVYRPQLSSSVLSIFHRITGVALSAGTILLVWWLAAAAMGPEAYDKMQACLASPLGLAALLGWTFALFYHLCAGLRHLFMDTGHGFAIPSIHKSAWLVIIAALALTAVTWVYALGRL